jgi:ribonucleoside-diphosphate reductase alpha chain
MTTGIRPWSFCIGFRGATVTAQDLSKFIHVGKYANYMPEDKRREAKHESGDRMMDMHVDVYGHLGDEVKGAIEFARSAFHDDVVLGSQRCLQYGGAPVIKKNARAYNCTVSYCDRPRFFAEAFWLLLCGCGTGFSVQKHHVAKLPGIAAVSKENEMEYVVPDTIEGWADALSVLLSSYFDSDETPFPAFRGWNVKFDYSLIRPEGSPLSSTTSGTAPGPEPLRQSLELIRDLLDRCTADGQTELRSIDAYDVIMHASDAVLAGGVRRSASICIFSADDDEMAQAKVGAWQRDNPQRGRSNNSALLLRGETPRARFDWLVDCAQTTGDPGFYWADSTEFIPNPCVEIGMMPVDSLTGLTGWQMCNLSTINMEACKTREDALAAAKAAAIMGTLQAGYTNFEYLGVVSERITSEEALLGVSMTGMMRNPEMSFDAELLKEMAGVVKDTNAWLADLLGINVAARATCLKPEGTGSLVLQTSSGITADHARRYFRLAAANHNEEQLKFFEAINPDAVEASTWSRDGTGKLVTFCIQAPEGAMVKDNWTAVELLEKVKLVKEAWVDNGKRPELCRHESLSHNVSNTINVGPGEWDQVADYIFENQHSFAGVALTSSFLDLDIRQAPNTAVKTGEEIMTEYGEGSLFASGLVDVAMGLFEDLWAACDTALGSPMGYGVDMSQPTLNAMHRKSQVSWCSAVKKLANHYFNDDVKRATYCLKDLYLLARWNQLTASWMPVDYTQMIEEENNVKLEGTIACAGGSCEVSF